MHSVRTPLLRLLVCIAALVAAPASAQYVPNQVLVQFKSFVSAASRDSAVSAIGGSIVDSLTLIDYYIVELADTSVVASVTALQASTRVEAVQKNGRGSFPELLTVPNDTLYYDQWQFKNTGQHGGTAGADIDAELGWNYIHDAPDVVIGVLDTGADVYYQPDLVDNRWVNIGETGLDSLGQDKRTNGWDDDHNGYADDVYGWDFVNNEGNVYNNEGHGTASSGYAAARGNNTAGVPGTAWQAKIMTLAIRSNVEGQGTWADEDKIAAAVEYAVANGAKIINNSWQSYGGFGDVLRDAYEAASNAGLVITCGSGNKEYDNDSVLPVPTSYNFPGLIAVAMTDRDDVLAAPCPNMASGTGSNYGATTVHLAAPGCNLWGVYPGSNNWHFGGIGHSGTSATGPMVAGAAALLLAQNPGWTNVQVKSRLMTTIDTLASCSGKMVAPGRLNIGRALDNVKPSAISDLAVDNVGQNQMAITWTDTGDDTTYGQSTKYHFKYQTGSAITSEGQFASAATVPHYLGPPGTSGTYHCVIVSGLSSCTTYGWALKLEDPEFNTSHLSNSTAAWTDCYASYAICGGGLMAGGGDGGEGGGEESAVLPGGTQLVSTGVNLNGLADVAPLTLTNETAGGFSWRAENALRVGTEGEATDLLAMKSIRPTSDGDYRVRLAATGDQAVVLSDASLAVVDHAEGTVALVTPSGIFSGTPGPIASASVGGMNRTGSYQSGEGAISEEGETINVALSGDGTTLLALELAAQAAIAEISPGTVDIETQDRQGRWSTAATISPRRGLDRVAVDVTDAAGVRVRVGCRVFIRSISKLTQAREDEPTWLELSSLRLSGEGETEPGSIALAPSEHAVLTFSGVNQEAESRTVFLRVTSQSEASAQYIGATDTDRPAPEIAFALAMRPNPAAGHVAVDFTVVRDLPVKIRMYDVAGRVVRTLADGLQTAGSHSVVWDGRNDAGAAVHGGVYFCKMDVGIWTSMKKMVFIAQR
jgi:hypothetical protein